MLTNLPEKRRRFEDALEQFLKRIAEDRCILAAVLVGSLTDETIWQKEELHLWLIEIDGVTKKLKTDGNEERIFRTLIEDEIVFVCEMIPRSRFKMMVEGSARTVFSCNFFAERHLVYCDDSSIKKWFSRAKNMAVKDQERELLSASCWAVHSINHARNLFEHKKSELQRIRECLMWGAYGAAALEIIKAGEVYEHYLMHRAIELNPDLFQVIYIDMLAGKPARKKLQTAFSELESYVEENAARFFKPVVTYLKKQRRLVPMSELSEHFAYSQVYPWHIKSACEWLSDAGEIEKFSSPFKLTKKSRVDVEEPAYMFNG